MMSTVCQHERFESQVNVFRLIDSRGSEVDRVVGYTAEVEIRCAECEAPMLFRGLQAGSSPDEPTISFDRRQLRAPVEPAL